MGHKFSLDGAMIPRAVRRVFDEREEERIDVGSQSAVLAIRGRNHVVRLLNLSRAGAMVIYHDMPHIGEEVSLKLLERGDVGGYVRWVRDGRVGIHFARPLE